MEERNKMGAENHLQPGDFVDSTSEARTVNNVMRHEYRVLSDAEKASMARIKDAGRQLWIHANKPTAFGVTLDALADALQMAINDMPGGSSREATIATKRLLEARNAETRDECLIKIEECVMWAVKHIIK
jgi:hypothetical protein